MKALLALLLFAAPLAAVDKPNIVFLLIDDLGRQDIGCHGSTFHKTPHIDRLAREGMVFEEAYSAHPRCVPSRYAIFSGRMPHREGVPGSEDKSQGKIALALKRVTFAERLKEAGYATGYIGKWHLGGGEGAPCGQGFDDSRITGEAGAPTSYFHPFHLTSKGQHKEGEKFPVVEGRNGEYLTDRLTDEAVDFLRKNKGKPFLMVLAHYAVHTPFQAPGEMIKDARAELKKSGKAEGGTASDPDFKNADHATHKTEQNNPIYAAMVRSMDDSVGRVVAELDSLGVAKNTLIILTSDHGGLSSRGENSQRPLATTNLPYRAGKGWLYDGGLRVPMIVRWPATVNPGRSRMQTLGTDHYASILEAVGLKADPAEALDSVSYLPALIGENKTRGPLYFHSPKARPGQTGDRNASALINGKWKIFQHLDDGKLELYNLESDPGESKDLASIEPDKFVEMKTLLEVIQKDTNAIHGGKRPFAGKRNGN